MKFLLLLAAVAVVFFAYQANLFLGIALSIVCLMYCIYKVLPAIYKFRSIQHMGNGNYDSALNSMRKAVSFKKNDLELKIELAYVLMRTGKLDEAENVLNNILVRNNIPSSLRSKAVIQRSLCYYKQDRLDEAYADAIELYNDGFRNMTLYGLIGYFKLVMAPKSQDTFDFCAEAYDYADDDRDICDNMLMCYYNRGQYGKAKEISDGVIEKNPHFVEAWYHAAQIDVKLGDYRSAKEKLEKIKDCNRSFMTTIPESDVSDLINEVNKKLEV